MIDYSKLTNAQLKQMLSDTRENIQHQMLSYNHPDLP